MPVKKFPKVFISLILVFLLMGSTLGTAGAAAQVTYHTGLNGMVCLTIDDGYGRNYVKRALDLLRAKKVHCTFFVIGSRLKAMPDLWQQAIKDGNEICYHSMNHKSMSGWSKAAILKDLNQWNKTAKQVLGASYTIPKFARLPGGSGEHVGRIQNIFAALGYKLIYWSEDTYTGVIRKNHHNVNKRITQYIKSKTKTNAIILTHFNCYDIPALPNYIDWLRGHFKLGTISEAFAPKPTPTPTLKPTATPTHKPTPTPTPKPTPTSKPTQPPKPTHTPAPSPKPTGTAGLHPSPAPLLAVLAGE